jgi:hypothetical protein
MNVGFPLIENLIHYNHSYFSNLNLSNKMHDKFEGAKVRSFCKIF